MKKMHIVLTSIVFLLMLGAGLVIADHNRVPTVNGDNNAWGTVLNHCLDNIMDASCNLDADVVVSADITDATITSADIGVDVIDDVDVVDDGLDASSLADTLNVATDGAPLVFTTDDTNGIMIGSAVAPTAEIEDIFSIASGAINIGDIDGTCLTSVVAVAGAVLGDTVIVTPVADDPVWDSASITGFVESAGNVKIVICDGVVAAGALDPAEMTYRITVISYSAG